MAMRQPLAVIGTPLYCPDCKRQLVSFNKDGTFDIAGLAGVTGSAQSRITEEGEIQLPEDMVVTEAICYLRRCRWKRWLRNHKPKRSP